MLLCVHAMQTLCNRRSLALNNLRGLSQDGITISSYYSNFMFRVVTKGFSQEFKRWTDAVHTANSLKPKCKSWFEDIRVFDGENLVWVYSLSHTYPQYIGPGTYRRLAILFLQEAAEEEAQVTDDSSNNPR